MPTEGIERETIRGKWRPYPGERVRWKNQPEGKYRILTTDTDKRTCVLVSPDGKETNPVPYARLELLEKKPHVVTSRVSDLVREREEREKRGNRSPSKHRGRKKVPIEDMEDWQQDRESLYQDGKWGRLSWAFGWITSDRNARVLSFLEGWQRTCGKERLEFFCLTREIVKILHIHPRTQEDIFWSLRREGWIKTEMRGHPAKRWIAIQWGKIREEVEKAELEWEKKYPPLS